MKAIYNKINKSVPIILTILIVILIFFNWFISPVSLGGDFNFISFDHFRFTNSHPYIWDSSLGNGFGQYTLFTLPFFYYSFLANKLTLLVSNPFLLHKIIYLIPLLIISNLSIFTFSKYFIKNKIAQSFSIILYLANPYFIMLTSGGQIGVAFAYGFSPLVLYLFFNTLKNISSDENKIISKKILKQSLLNGLALSLLIAFDSRLALLIFVIIVFAYTLTFLTNKNKTQLLKKYSILAFTNILIILAIHAYWILPSIFVKSVELPSGYSSTQSVQFFSFARLAHATSWSHPNYPENIFGKVNEVIGITFIFPILAFASLKLRRKTILFFASVAVLSAFLVKGTNPPLGAVYTWIFSSLPFGSWFRDSTKFYLPLSISYSVLIGLSIQELLKILPQKIKSINQNTLNFFSVIILTTIIFISWQPTFTNQISGTLSYKTFPQNYNNLREILKNDNGFGRVLWLPQKELYGYTSLNHPAVSLNELRQTPTCVNQLCIKESKTVYNVENPFTYQDLESEIDQKQEFLSEPNAAEILNSLAIQYLVVPADIDKNIYLFDRKFNQSIKEKYQTSLENLNYAHKILDDQGLVVYKIEGQTALFTTLSNQKDESVLSYNMISPTQYQLEIPENTNDLIFSQQYNSNWQLIDQSKIVDPERLNPIGMRFQIQNASSPHTVLLRFKGQQFADTGWLISNISLSIIIISLIYLTFYNNKKI